MSDKKQNIVKIILGIVVAAAAGAGGDAAGLAMPDPAELERLGIVGSLIVVVYFHTVAMPWIKRGVLKLEALPSPAAASAPELAETVVEEQAVPAPAKRVATAPHLRAIKPHKDPT